MELDDVLEFVAMRLSRTKNYPRTVPELDALGEAVISASKKTGVEIHRIVDRCAEVSGVCPTDYDLLTVAKEIKIQDEVAAGTHNSLAKQGNAQQFTREQLEAQYGPPQPIAPKDLRDQLVAIGKAAQSKESEMWRKIKLELRQAPGQKSFAWPDWTELANVAEKLGYGKVADRWRNSYLGGGR
jgi:hypothetical protein